MATWLTVPAGSVESEARKFALKLKDDVEKGEHTGEEVMVTATLPDLLRRLWDVRVKIQEKTPLEEPLSVAESLIQLAAVLTRRSWLCCLSPLSRETRSPPPCF